MPDTQLYPQIWSVAGSFESRRQEPLHARLLETEKRSKGCLAVNFGTHNGRPPVPYGAPSTYAASKQDLVPFGASRRRRIVERVDVHTDLTGIRERT